MVQLFDFLDDYTKQHFHDEEMYMQNIRYPEIEVQKTAHKKFIADLAKLKTEYQTSGGNISLIINANQMIIDWLTKHISNMDKKIGAYAKIIK